MFAEIAVQTGLAAVLVAAVLAGSGLLVGALVVALASVVGLGAALAVTGFGFLTLALLLGVWLRSLARAARRRRSTMAAMAELGLRLLPAMSARRLAAGVTAGIGLAALVVLLVLPGGDRES